MDNISQSELTTASIENLIENYSKRLLNRAYYMLSNKEDAEDVVQEVFMVAYNKREVLMSVNSVEAWLSGVLHNKVADLYRERYKKPVVSIDFGHDFDKYGEWKRTDVSREWHAQSEPIELLLDDTGFRDSFYDCIEKLPPRWKIVVKLCYLQSQSGSKICDELKISTTNYWKLLQRSRLQLRECIDINWFNQ